MDSASDDGTAYLGSHYVCYGLGQAVKSTVTLSTAELAYMLGSSTDTWGCTWAAGDFANTNLRVRVIDVASSTARDFSLDWIALRVTYR